MTPIFTIPIAAGVVFLIQLTIYLVYCRRTNRKYKRMIDQYPSATRKRYPLVVDAKLDPSYEGKPDNVSGYDLNNSK